MVSLLALTTSWALLASAAHATGAVAPLPASDYVTRDVCAPPATGYAGCLAVQLVPETSAARAHTHPLAMTRPHAVKDEEAAAEGGYGLRPEDLHTVYQLPTQQAEATSNPQTIAVVDAFDDANAEADLAVYDAEFSLPSCTTANGCFRKVNQSGASTPLPNSTEEEERSWAGEIATDVEVAHAVCQDCHILLVEAESAKDSSLEAAERTAERLGATEISNSWGSGEPPSDSSAFNDAGVVITASSGDDGYLNWDAPKARERGGADYPASSPHVVAVGGTRLSLASTGPDSYGWAGESVWNGSGAGGSGCSTKFYADVWQRSVADWPGVGCPEDHRAVADVAADADPYTGVAIYDSTPDPSANDESGWGTVGGTSVASPIIAAIYGLVGGAHGVAYPAETLYANLTSSLGSLHDVSSGSNGECHKPFHEDGTSGCSQSEEAAGCAHDFICTASTGYDGPSGVGTPDGIGAFELTSGQEPEGASGNPEEAPSKVTEEPQGEPSGGGASKAEAGQTATPTTSQSTVTTPPLPQVGAASIRVSGLTLTLNAVVALNRSNPKPSSIGFTFSLSAPARVRITLARKKRVRGHIRWASVVGARIIAASVGHNRASLTGRHRRLAQGSYRLTLAPAGGVGQSLMIVIG
jgi:hypothetical protein